MTLWGAREGRTQVERKPKGSERRVDVRTPANWPGQVQWKDGEETHVRQAIIRNYSAAGVYFELDYAGLEPGAKLECRVEMPAEIAFGTGVILNCVGEVVHVKTLTGDPTRIGVGFRTDELSFAELTPTPKRR